MTRKSLLILTCCLLSSIALVTVLFAFSNYITHQPGSFYRIFPPHPVIESNMMGIEDDSYYIAGGTSEYIYLANTKKPFHLLAINTLLTDTLHIRLRIEDVDRLKYYRITVKIDSPYFYLMDGAIPYIYKGRMDNWRAKRFAYDSAYFVDAEPMSPSSFAIRSVGLKTLEHVLGKETTDTPHVRLNYGLLEKQVDGIFCTDGTLHYDKELARLIHVYFYRNQYMVIDTNMNLAYRGNTIDTFSHAQVKVGHISSENSTTMNAPPPFVNKSSCVFRNWLLIHSNLLSKNEDPKTFDRASVIDVYDLQSREYKFSFYLADHEKEKIKGFRIFNKRLFSSYNHYIMSYDLNKNRFQVPGI
jgi:hypothetical protein